MKAKILLHIKKNGDLVVDTVKNVGQGCKAIADIFANAVGTIDENSRGKTADYDVDPIETDQDIHGTH